MNLNKKKLRPFHLAFPVDNIKICKKWYVDILGCTIGRESEKWVDFNFFGHQISAHLSEKKDSPSSTYNNVDSHQIPSRHFGIILNMDHWELLTKRLIKLNINFEVKPYIRFKNKRGEQATFFIKDPSENYIEFKAFKDDKMIFNH